MEKIDIIAIVHRIFTDGQRKRGGFDKILENFSLRRSTILLIEHPLSGLQEKGNQKWNEVIISKIIKGEIVEIERKKIFKTKYFIRWVFEIFFNIFYIADNVKNNPVLISSDSLNNLTGIFYFWKFRKKYYHCVDYSKNRFLNKILNYIYQLSFILTINVFDLIGTVSLLTQKELKLLGAKEKQLIYVPNSPEYKKISISNNKNNIIICTGGSIIDKYNYEAIIKIICELKKTFADIKLIAVGGRDVDKQYFSKIKSLIKINKIEKNVIFTGFINENQIENLLLKAKIGLSFYSESVNYYTKFGDSLKIREYALFGIPSIADGNSATDKEMMDQKCGYIINNPWEAVLKITELLLNKKIYNGLVNNCTAWAKKTDKKTILNSLWKKIADEKNNY